MAPPSLEAFFARWQLFFSFLLFWKGFSEKKREGARDSPREELQKN